MGYYRSPPDRPSAARRPPDRVVGVRRTPGASRLVTSAIASAEGGKYFRTFSGSLYRDFTITRTVTPRAVAIPVY